MNTQTSHYLGESPHRSIKIRVTLVFSFAVALLLCGLGQAHVHGQSLAITPALVDAKVKPGSTYNKAFTITNDTPTRVRLRCSVADFWYNENNERVDGLPGTLPRSASPWVQFSPAEAIIEANSSFTVNAVISVPQDSAGGYYTVPIFEAEAADQNNSLSPARSLATAAVMIRFRGLLLLTTENTTEYNVEIMKGQITPPSASSEFEMQLDVRNRSNAHARVHGIFAIFDSAGKLAGRGTIDEKRYMPGQRNFLKANWAGTLSPGHYTTVVTLSYDRAGGEPATLTYELPFDVK
jgi:hypothetical protein